jgi:tRNA threonylcarbamoyladenosine biosynthesis protein TsaB
MICCIQTGQDPISVAIMDGSSVKWMTTLKSTFQITENIIDLIESGLRQSQLSWKDLNAVAVNKGPGSYTGIRIGVTTANTLAQTLNIPLFGFTSLEVLMNAHVGHNSIGLAVLRARKSEYNVALFSLKNFPVKRISDDVVLSKDALINKVAEFEERIQIIGDVESLTATTHSLIHSYPSSETLGIMANHSRSTNSDLNHFPVHPVYPYGSI